jgi:ParB family chromosome partitioning protein
VTQKQALGRGLSALLPGATEPRPAGVQEVEIGQLTPSRYQPRRQMAELPLAELADSIREHGIIQPIVVARRGDKLEIIAGERRWRAASLAGLKTVPIVFRDATDEKRLELALVENLQREDLNPMEAAEAYWRLREEFHLSQEQIAKRLGRDRTTVANTMRLSKLPNPVKEKVRDGSLSAGHAKALLGLSSPDDQVSLSEEILRRGLSVRQTESRVASMGAETKMVREKRADPFTRDAEEKLSRRLKTKVRIARRRRGGRIEIAFGSEEELIRLYDRLSGKE